MQNLGICRNFDIADSVWINLKDIIETKYKFVRTKYFMRGPDKISSVRESRQNLSGKTSEENF